MHWYPDQYQGLNRLLQVTRSISVTCDTSMSNLSDLSGFDELEECELRWCHQMYQVTGEHGYWKNLRNVHASNLKSLAHFYEPYIENPSFSTLEHLHLEYCPRLFDMMPSCSATPPGAPTAATPRRRRCCHHRTDVERAPRPGVLEPPSAPAPSRSAEDGGAERGEELVGQAPMGLTVTPQQL